MRVLPDNQPLVKRKSIHHKQSDLDVAGVLSPDGQRNRGRWCNITGGTGGRLISPAYRCHEPGGEPRIHLLPQAPDALASSASGTVSACLFERMTNSAQPRAKCNQSQCLASSDGMDDCRFSISLFRRRDFPREHLVRTPMPTQVLDKPIRMLVGYGMQKPLKEQIVHVNPNVMVVKGQIEGAVDCSDHTICYSPAQ